MGHYYDCPGCGWERGHASGCPHSRDVALQAKPAIKPYVCPPPVAGRKQRVDQTIHAYHDGRTLDSRDIPDLIGEIESLRKKLKRKARVLGRK